MRFLSCSVFFTFLFIWSRWCWWWTYWFWEQWSTLASTRAAVIYRRARYFLFFVSSVCFFIFFFFFCSRDSTTELQLSGKSSRRARKVGWWCLRYHRVKRGNICRYDFSRSAMRFFFFCYLPCTFFIFGFILFVA